ncbi:protein SCAF11 isoform X2 [Hypomesus transpacificus]|uniref:protein SCAF11 isoform X2 n=1 Tax=Hypomesus transpacificus TaxID=137520 RepID=UPI001F07E1D5|nr:protein SCAF11 isoform X2 [Hypomesus transpacificus]
MAGKSENDELREFTVNEVAERCPICLGVMSQDNLAMPDSCCHIFCLGCILTWAESQTVPSCPVDRQSFNVIYKWDTTLGLVLVPVTKKIGALEPERSQQKELQMTQRTPAKEKSHIKKCKDKDPSVISRKKVRPSLHFTWSLSPSGTALGTLIQVISEPLWVAEEEFSVSGRKQCRHQIENFPWLLAAVPVSALGDSRHWLNAAGWRNSQFPLRSFSPFSISTTHSGFGHFVFQGRGYAVTCPKGGEKKGGRTSSSRSPFKQTECMTSRRSNRNSRAQEQAPLHDAASSQSQSSDSDLSANMSPPLGKAPLATRKGKRPACRKSEGKKAGHGRRKTTPRLLSRLTASEEDDGVDKEIEKNKQGKEENNVESGNSDAESTPLQWNQNSSLVNEEQGPKPLLSNFILEQGEVRSQVDKDSSPDEQLLVKQTDSEEGVPSSPTEASLDCHGVSFDGSQADDHKKTFSGQEDSSLHSSSVLPLESPKFLQSGKHLEEVQDENAYPVRVFADSVEKNFKKDISIAVNADDSQFSDSPVDTKPLKAQDTSENKAFGNVRIHSSQDWTNEISKTTTKVENQSRDDTDGVPMDCDTPSSEHNNDLTINPQIESSIINAELLAPTSLSLLVGNVSQQEQESSRGMESQDKRNGRQRQSRFHSASTTWSPKKDSRQDSSQGSSSGSREHTRERDGSPPSSHSTHIRSWDRGGDNKKDSSKKECNHEEKSRRRSRSKSLSRNRSRSNSRSRSRTRLYKRGTSPEQPTSGAQSPSWKTDRWGGERWRADHRSGGGDKSRFKNDSFGDPSPDQGCLTNPDWVQEKTAGDAGARSHETLSVDENNRWDDQVSSGLSDSWRRCGIPTGCGGSERRSPGQGGYRMCNQPEEQGENRWQSRNNFSGTAKNSGSDSYSRFNENRGSRRKEADLGELPLDRSGWSSASSWAVRRTLPADVQSYYSRRERGAGGGGGWIRREEDQPTTDLPKDDLTLQTQSESQVSLGVMHPHFNVLHYPLGQHGVPVNLQSAAPYVMPPQVPIHLHPTVPLLQVPCVTAQGLPPPPPPPPPMQHGSLTAAQPDSRTTQKLQIQERAVNEVKTAIKPYYQKKDITKEEYKEIVRKAVEKVCHSKSGEVNSGKVANLVKAYVDKYKHVRKK